MISGKTTIIAHLGYPTEAFKAPMIYNPYFEQAGIDAVVIPMGVTPEDYASFVRPLFRLTNIRGALVTMPHKVTTVGLLDEVTPTVRIAGSCNAILKRDDGSQLWIFATRGKVDSSPVICGDKVVAGSDDGRLYMVSLETGKELWKYEIGQPIGSSPALAEGRVVIGSDDGSVYCFGAKAK